MEVWYFEGILSGILSGILKGAVVVQDSPIVQVVVAQPQVNTINDIIEPQRSEGRSAPNH